MMTHQHAILRATMPGRPCTRREATTEVPGREGNKKTPRNLGVVGEMNQLRRQESNLRPPGYEPGELAAAPRRTGTISRTPAEGKTPPEIFSTFLDPPAQFHGCMNP